MERLVPHFVDYGKNFYAFEFVEVVTVDDVGVANVHWAHAVDVVDDDIVLLLDKWKIMNIQFEIFFSEICLTIGLGKLFIAE